MSKRVLSAILATLLIAGAAVAFPRDHASAVLGENLVTGAAAGVFPSGANYAGIQLAGGTYGLGVQTSSDGSATGDLEVQFNGTSFIGLDQDVTVTAWITSASTNPDGSMTLNGTSKVDLGDGSPASTGVPTVATVSAAGLQLTLGASALPTLPRSDGWLSIE